MYYEKNDPMCQRKIHHYTKVALTLTTVRTYRVGPFCLLVSSLSPDYLKKGGKSIEGLLQARIIRVNYASYIAETNDSLFTLQVSGRFLYTATSKADYPVVGDYVYFRETEQNKGIIERIEERNNTLERLATTIEYDRQILASNVDMIFICMSLNDDFNLTKLQHFIDLANQQMIPYHILLTKQDLCEDINIYINDVRTITDQPIDVISVFEIKSINMIESVIGTQTVVLLGSSGVGKSSLINAILGQKVLEVNDIRLSDAQGRHTTTHRELIHTSSGGAIIDTPGIRIIQSFLLDNLDEQFEDIMEFATSCKFRDCKHDQEPDCKVQEAIELGDLASYRLEEYNNALRVQRYHEQRAQKKQQIEEKRRRHK